MTRAFKRKIPCDRRPDSLTYAPCAIGMTMWFQTMWFQTVWFQGLVPIMCPHLRRGPNRPSTYVAEPKSLTMPRRIPSAPDLVSRNRSHVASAKANAASRNCTCSSVESLPTKRIKKFSLPLRAACVMSCALLCFRVRLSTHRIMISCSILCGPCSDFFGRCGCSAASSAATCCSLDCSGFLVANDCALAGLWYIGVTHAGCTRALSGSAAST